MANFEASRLKVARSRTHLWALLEAIRAYQLRAPFHIEVEIDNGKKFWVAKVREEVPLEFSAILGDSIHNLRAALDLLACELVRLNHQSDADVYFPFANSAADFPAMMVRRHMDRASSQAQALLHSLAPLCVPKTQIRT